MTNTKSRKTSKTNKIEKPVWLKYTEKEVCSIILKLAEQGLTAEKIGLALRDQYGIPKAKIYGIKIKQVLEEKDKFKEPTNSNLKKKFNKIISHYKKNKQDKTSERALIVTRAKFKKREDYLKKK